MFTHTLTGMMMKLERQYFARGQFGLMLGMSNILQLLRLHLKSLGSPVAAPSRTLPPRTWNVDVERPGCAVLTSGFQGPFKSPY